MLGKEWRNKCIQITNPSLWLIEWGEKQEINAFELWPDGVKNKKNIENNTKNTEYWKINERNFKNV